MFAQAQQPRKKVITCKEDMGGKGVGAHQDSRQNICAVVKVEAHKGCIPVDGWEDGLVACGIEELGSSKKPGDDCIPGHRKRL